MGRLFQYNRLGYDSETRKDIPHPHNLYKRKENNRQASKTSAYSELYGEYEKQISNADVNESSSGPRENAWLNRLLCTDCFSNDGMTCQVYSWPIAQRNKSDSEPLKSSVKRARLFHCIKEFFTRKLFQQQENSYKNASQSDSGSTKNWETIDDITSDYEDIDNIESSYNADEEDDCDDGCADNCACDGAASKRLACSTSLYRNPAKSSPLRSGLSFSCYHPQMSVTGHHVTKEHSRPVSMAKALLKCAAAESSNTSEDDGISDCCKLITQTSKLPRKPSSTYCRKAKRIYGRSKLQRPRISGNNDEQEPHSNNDADDSDECSDLRKASWYQPRITTKAVYERLRHSSAGSFLIRRKARTFELCLRTETKVKHFAIIHGTDDESYKLKGARKQFSSLNALVTHHSVMAEQLPLTLVLPRESTGSCLRRMSLHRYKDDFDTFESLQILGILQSLQAKNFHTQ